MERPPFNFPNPLNLFGGVKQVRPTIYMKLKPFILHSPFSVLPQISAEAAYLYDAVHLYTKALLEVLDSGGKPRNGSAIVAAIKGSRYHSAMG